MNRLFVNMINFGLSDFSLRLGSGETMNGIKCVLCYSNEIFRKLLLDTQVEDPLPVAENISKESMMMLFQYYGGGIVEINEENVCGILLLSLYYNEKELFCELKDYVINHMNVDIVKDLLNNVMKIEKLNELYDLCDNYIRDNIYLMIENEILNEICINGLKHILNLDNILVRNENTVLNSLLSYYKVNKSEIEENNELKNEFSELLEYVNWKKVDNKIVSFEELTAFKSIQEIVIKSSKHEFNRQYCSIPDLSNSKFSSILRKYYLNPKLLSQFEGIILIKSI